MHRLRERADFNPQQAEGLAEALAEAFQEQIATKSDLELLRQALKADIALFEQRLTMEMVKLEQRLSTKIGAMLAAAIGILLALERLIK